MKPFAIIVAVDRESGIGKNGGLPWRLSRDMQRFRDVTLAAPAGSQNVLIMGRKTWESLPPKFRPLPGRLNVVISSQSGLSLPEGVHLSSSFEAALHVAAEQCNAAGVFVIGGSRVFAEAIGHPACTRLYMTHIHAVFGCDVFFPPVPQMYSVRNQIPPINENGIEFHFCDYVRE